MVPSQNFSSRLLSENLVAVLLGMAACIQTSVGETIERGFESGPVTATLQVTPAAPVIGDSVTLTIQVKTKKDVEILMPEFGEALDDFSVLTFVPREFIDEDGDTVYLQTYKLQPRSSGQQAVPPILIEYIDRREGQREAPEGLDAYELLTERIEFDVQSVLPDDAQADLKPPLGKLEPRIPPSPSKLPWFLVVLIVLLAGTPFAIRSFLSWRRRARRRSAYEIARIRLDRLLAQPRPTNDQVDAFFVALSGIVRRYLEDRFDLRAPEFTTEEFLASVGNSPDFSQPHQALLRQFLRQADLVKFAGVQPSEEDIENSINSARQFLEETRENAPMLDVAENDVNNSSAAKSTEKPMEMVES
ncbi:MAG: BatD family protein [Pirellulaceae bacterium]|nr:BatD family protein [Pirellulaceae bacterium]